MLKPKIEAALNQQINHELAASYSYLGMTAYFEAENLKGFAAWMRSQYNEEQMHANRLFAYVLDRGGKVTLDAIDKPVMSYKSPLAAFEAGLKMERANTAEINELYGLAQQECDWQTQSHLQWFLDEQVEEEKVFDEAVSLLKRAGTDASALLLLNDQFGARPTSTPATGRAGE